jgi:hypothetical protein
MKPVGFGDPVFRQQSPRFAINYITCRETWTRNQSLPTCYNTYLMEALIPRGEVNPLKLQLSSKTHC